MKSEKVSIGNVNFDKDSILVSKQVYEKGRQLNYVFLVGGTKIDVTKEYTKDLTIGAGAGALSGVVFGALAGGSVGKGAALGTAVGAGGGLVKSIIDKGNDVEIPANASIELMLTQPITVNPALYQNNY